MYTLIRSLTVRTSLVEQLPILLLSMLVAELFYNFPASRWTPSPSLPPGRHRLGRTLCASAAGATPDP